MADKKKLTPPDFERCQAEKPNGHSFMTLGGRPALERCDRKPTVLVTENQPGKDGQKGAMTLCDGCLAQFRKQMPRDYATIQDLSDVPHWRRIDCDLCEKPAIYEHPKGGRRCATCPRPEK